MKNKNTSVKASLIKIRIAPRKLNLVASVIKALKVSEAILQLSFMKRKKIAREVKKCLQSAIANAENNFGMDIDRLIVKTVMVGKAGVLKRMMPRARGRSAGIKKFLSNLYIELVEGE